MQKQFLVALARLVYHFFARVTIKLIPKYPVAVFSHNVANFNLCANILYLGEIERSDASGP